MGNEPGCDEVSGCTWATPDGEDEPTCTFTGFSATATTVIAAVTASVLVFGVIGCLCKRYNPYFSKEQVTTEAATGDSVLDVNDDNDNVDSTNDDEAQEDLTYTSTRKCAEDSTTQESSTHESTTRESSITETSQRDSEDEEMTGI